MMDLVIEGTSVELCSVGEVGRDIDLRVKLGWRRLPLSMTLRPSFHTSSSPRGHFSFPVFSSTSGKKPGGIGEIGRRQDYQQTVGHTREGPLVLSRTSLSDGTGIDDGSHGAEGKDGRSRREI